MGVAALCGFHQLVHDVLRRGLVRVAHAEVDDVLATPARRHLEFADHVEDVRRKSLDAGEFFGQGSYTFLIGLEGTSGVENYRRQAPLSNRNPAENATNAGKFCTD